MPPIPISWRPVDKGPPGSIRATTGLGSGCDYPWAYTLPEYLSATVPPVDPETAMQVTLWLLDGTSLSSLQILILVLDGKATRRSGD